MNGKAVVAGSLCCLAWGSGTGAGVPECSIAKQYFPRSPDGLALVARATGDTVAYPLDPAGAWPRIDPGPIADGDWVWGQMFVVLRVAGGRSDVPLVGDTVPIVPWGYGPSCRLQPWEESALWVTEGDVGLFLTDEWQGLGLIQGRINVLGWHDPYPQGAFIQDGSSRLPQRSEWMGVDALFELNRDLPVTSGRIRSPEYEEALLRWADANPDAAARFPVGREVARIRGSVRR